MLEQITRARVAGDAASLRVAHQYLQHDYLKGFPVPSMHVHNVELELTFAVAPGWKPRRAFDDPDLRLNAVNQIEHFVRQLADLPELRPAFAQDPRLAERWNAGLPALRDRADRALQKERDRPSLLAALQAIVDNHVYAALRDRLELLSRLLHPFSHGGQAPAPDVRQQVADGVRDIVTSLDDTSAEAEALLDSPDIGVMIGRDELDKVPESKLQKMRITVSATDRRWVVSHAGGQPVHTLTR
jgi:hypothetical protein